MALDLVLRDEEQTEYTLHFFHASDLPDNPLVVVAHEVFIGPLALEVERTTSGVGAPTVANPGQSPKAAFQQVALGRQLRYIADQSMQLSQSILMPRQNKISTRC